MTTVERALALQTLKQELSNAVLTTVSKHGWDILEQRENPETGKKRLTTGQVSLKIQNYPLTHEGVEKVSGQLSVQVVVNALGLKPASEFSVNKASGDKKTIMTKASKLTPAERQEIAEQWLTEAAE